MWILFQATGYKESAMLDRSTGMQDIGTKGEKKKGSLPALNEVLKVLTPENTRRRFILELRYWLPNNIGE